MEKPGLLKRSAGSKVKCRARLFMPEFTQKKKLNSSWKRERLVP